MDPSLKKSKRKCQVFHKTVLSLMTLSCIITAAPSVWARTGVVGKILANGMVRIYWQDRGPVLSQGEIGLLFEGRRATAAWEIVSSKKRSSDVRTFEIWPGAVRAKQSAKSYEQAPLPPGKSAVFFWSAEVGSEVQVDGQAAGRVPLGLTLSSGTHEALLELPGGERAGAKFELKPDSRIVVPLLGRERTRRIGERGMRSPPRRGPQEKRPKTGPLLWVDYPDGERVFYTSGSLEDPKCVAKTKLTYPEIARLARISGLVVMEAIITTDGHPREIQVLSSPDPYLDSYAQEAVSQWRYEPGMLDGKAVPVFFTIVVEYYLS
jgi:TonB family protein